MPRVRWRGRIFDKRTAQMLQRVEKLVGFRLRPVQGSYSHGGLSAGTHSGGGAVDLSVDGLSIRQKYSVIRQMRRVGFSSWGRDRRDGFSPHIHGIANNTPDAAPIAKRQTISAKNGRNGLRSNLKDRFAWMNVKWTTWEAYQKTLKPRKPLKPKRPRWTSAEDYKLGDRNAGVKLIQRARRRPVTGKMSAADIKSVAYFQKKYGGCGRTDGVVNHATYKRLCATRPVREYYRP